MRKIEKNDLSLVFGGVAKAEGSGQAHRTSNDECSFDSFFGAFMSGFVSGGVGGYAVSGGSGRVGGAMKGGLLAGAGNLAVQDLKCGRQVYRDAREVYHLASGKGVQPDDPIQRSSK